MTVATALREACRILGRAGVEEARLDAEVLLGACLRRERSWLLGHPEADLPPEAEDAFRDRVRRRCEGDPVAWLTGEKEFYGLTFRVPPGVFVPRPETEGLVERAARLRAAGGGGRAADACTGSGAVAVALARAAGFGPVAATDTDPLAAATARDNAARLGAVVEVFEGDLLAPLFGTAWDGATALVCANPPYVRHGEIGCLPPEVRREPRSALDGGEDGLVTVRRLASQAARVLAPGGMLLVEIGDGQGAAAAEACRAAGFARAGVERDLSDRERYLLADRGPERAG